MGGNKLLKLNKDTDILNGNILSIIVWISIPIIITNFIDGFYGIIDSWFVSSIGSLEVAAVTFVSPIYETINAVGVGLSIAGGSLVGRYLGQKDDEKVSNTMEQLSIIALVIGCIMGIGSCIFAKQILIHASATENILGAAENYFRIIALTEPFWFLTLVYMAIRRAQGDTKATMKINMWSLILKIIFSAIFIFVFNMGIIGVALSTLLAKVLCSVPPILALFFKDPLVDIKKAKIRMPVIKGILIVAIPLILEKSMVSYGFVLINGYIVEFGEPVLAAYGLTNKVNTVIFKMTSAVGTGISVIVAQNLGAKNIDRVKEVIQKGVVMAIAFACVCALCVVPFRAQIAKMFLETTDPTYQHMVNAMGIYTISVIPWAITELSLGVFQGTALTGYNLLISLMRIYVFRLPTLAILTLPALALNESAIWYAMLISNILSAMFSFSLVIFRRKDIAAVADGSYISPVKKFNARFSSKLNKGIDNNLN